MGSGAWKAGSQPSGSSWGIRPDGKTFDRFCNFGAEKLLSVLSQSIHIGPAIDGTSETTRTSNPRRQHNSHGGNQSQCRLEEHPGAAVVAVVDVAGSVEVSSTFPFGFKITRHGRLTKRKSRSRRVPAA